MRRITPSLFLLAGLLVAIAIVVAGTAQAQPAPVSALLQTGDENCITCHTSKETLQELATEPEEEDLSEGEG